MGRLDRDDVIRMVDNIAAISENKNVVSRAGIPFIVYAEEITASFFSSGSASLLFTNDSNFDEFTYL